MSEGKNCYVQLHIVVLTCTMLNVRFAARLPVASDILITCGNPEKEYNNTMHNNRWKLTRLGLVEALSSRVAEIEFRKLASHLNTQPTRLHAHAYHAYMCQ